MIGHLMHDEAIKVSVSRNKFGEYVYKTTGEAFRGRIREQVAVIAVNGVETRVSDTERADAIFWCKPGSLDKGDVIKCRNAYWRVVTAITANTFDNAVDKFTKCFLVLHAGALS